MIDAVGAFQLLQFALARDVGFKYKISIACYSRSPNRFHACKNRIHMSTMLRFLSMLVVACTGSFGIPTSLTDRDTSNCPLSLPGNNYEFPHLIVPTNKSDVALGISYFAEVSPNNCATSFNFDIPTSRANQQCTVYFSLPRHDQLVTSNFKWNGANTGTEGPGSLRFVQYKYNTGVNQATTGNSEPPLGPDPPISIDKITPGNSYKVWSGSCGPGGVMSWRMSSTDSSLMYFQDWNPCAIGLWIIYSKIPPRTLPECGHCPYARKVSSHAAWMREYTGEADAEALSNAIAWRLGTVDKM